MIRDADLNGNGVIELDEFIEMMTKQTRTLSSDDSIRQAFRVFDKNGDSFISRDEIRYDYRSNVSFINHFTTFNLLENIGLKDKLTPKLSAWSWRDNRV